MEVNCGPPNVLNICVCSANKTIRVATYQRLFKSYISRLFYDLPRTCKLCTPFLQCYEFAKHDSFFKSFLALRHLFIHLWFKSKYKKNPVLFKLWIKKKYLTFECTDNYLVFTVKWSLAVSVFNIKSLN